MDTLPLEVWHLIFNHINRSADIGRCRLVCKAWNSYAEVAMLTAQIRIRTEFHAWKLCKYLKKKPYMAQYIRHLTIMAPHSTDTNGRAFVRLLSLAITSKTKIVDGIVGLDTVYKKLIQLAGNSQSSVAKIKMLPVPMNYNQTYLDAILSFKHTLQELILNFSNIPIGWDLIYCLDEFERLTSLTLTGDTYNITLTDTILKRCSNLTELDINVHFSDPIVLDRSSVHCWSSRNKVERVHGMRVLIFGALVRSDLLEYLIYKFPCIQTVQLTTNNVHATEWLLFKNKGFVRNFLRTFPTCIFHCYKHKSENVDRLVESLAESHSTVAVKTTDNARKVYIKACL